MIWYGQRHAGIAWSDALAKLASNAAALRTLQAMDASGGEPDVVGRDAADGAYLVVDCSAQSPKGRRSVCYERKALDARKENKPKDSAMDMAADMGCTILDFSNMPTSRIITMTWPSLVFRSSRPLIASHAGRFCKKGGQKTEG